jgi:hypothetical protein
VYRIVILIGLNGFAEYKEVIGNVPKKDKKEKGYYGGTE